MVTAIRRWFGVPAFLFLAACGSQENTNQLADTTIKSDGRNVYFITPWKDTFKEDRVNAVQDGLAALHTILKKNQNMTASIAIP